MFKRDFDCCLSDSSPSDTEGAQAAQDTEDDDDDSNSAFHPLPSRLQKIASTVSGFFCICKTFVRVERCVMLAFGLLPIKELALQVRESDS